MTPHDEFDTPLGGLRPARRVLLRHAQLELAIAEIRYAAVGAEVSVEAALQIREIVEATGLVWSQMQPMRQDEIALTSVGQGAPTPSIERSATGWQYVAGDQQLVATLMPDAVSVQTTRYTRWSESLKPAVEQLLAGVHSVLKPTLVQRIGLRYVNRLVDPDSKTPQAWEGRIRPTILGAVSDPAIGSLLANSQQQLDLALGPAQGAHLRHGVFRDPAAHGSFSYLVDIDVFDESSAVMDPTTIMQRATALNRTALALFQQVLTDEYLDQMEPYEPVEPDSTEAVGGADR